MLVSPRPQEPYVPLPFAASEPVGRFVFVSYAHSDKAMVYPQLHQIRSLGIRVWYDEGIDPGSEWPEAIANAINKAAAFVVMITPNAVESRNVRREINFALDLGKPTLVIHLAPAQMPKGLHLQLGDIQAIHRWNIDDASYANKLAKALRAYADRSPAAPPSSAQADHSKYGALLARIAASDVGTFDLADLIGTSTGLNAGPEVEKAALQLGELAVRKGFSSMDWSGPDMFSDLARWRLLRADDPAVNLVQASLASPVPAGFGRGQPGFAGALIVTMGRVAFAYRGQRKSGYSPGEGRQSLPGNLQRFAVPRAMIGNVATNSEWINVKTGRILREKSLVARLTLFLKRGDRVEFLIQGYQAREKADEVARDIMTW